MKQESTLVVAALVTTALIVAVCGAAGQLEEVERLHKQGVDLGIQGNFSQAKAAFNQALRVDPNIVAAQKCLELIAQVEAGAINHETASIFFKAIDYATIGQLDQAIQELDLALKLEPGVADTYNLRGYFYYEKGDFNQAIADYNRALQINPSSAPALCNRGVAYASKGEFDRARADFDRCIKINSRVALPFNNRGNVYRAMGDPDRAIVDYNRALQINPRYVEAYTGRGESYRMKGDLERSLADLNRALEINPKYATAWFNKALSCEKAGRTAEARKAYQKFLGYASSQDVVNIEKARSRIRALSGSQAKSPSAATGAPGVGDGTMTIDEMFSWMKNHNKGVYLMEAGKYNDALVFLNKAIEIAPNWGSYHVRANLYYKMGQYNKAWDDVKKAQSLKSDSVDLKFLEELRKASGREN